MKIVFPGDEIGCSEEYLNEEGCYEMDGTIYASTVGEVRVDKKNKMVGVTPKTDVPVVLKNGDMVVGRISDIRNSMAIVEVVALVGRERRAISTNKIATLFVSQISDSYVKSISDFYRIEDIIKARVKQAKPSLQISTNEKNLGVIKSFCRKCKSPLRVVGSRLYCLKCKTFENRAISSDYSKPIGIKENEKDVTK
jgi:Predicted RNA-binding protein (consists of S1 domain and a Zn-ribbon domain)